MDPRVRFLMALGSAIRNGAVKTIKQAMAFAKQQFGKVDEDFTSKIINVFHSFTLFVIIIMLSGQIKNLLCLAHQLVLHL